MHTLDLDGLLRRLHLPTVRRLVPELESRAEAEDLSYRDFLTFLLAEEVAHRVQTRIERSVRKARFPFLRAIEDFDFTFQTSIRLQLLGSYLGPELVTEGRSLILSGPSGTGKTHLAVAIAYRAIQNGYDARFTSAAGLIEALSAAAHKGGLAEALASYTHPHVLVIDEVGYLTVGANAANLLFQVVNDRSLHHRPMIFTTNKSLAAWGLVLHDPDLAEAILDRVLERGRLIELKGESYRTRHLKKTETLGRSPQPEPAKISGNPRQEYPEPTVGTLPIWASSGEGEPTPVLLQEAVPAHDTQPGASEVCSILYYELCSGWILGWSFTLLDEVGVTFDLPSECLKTPDAECTSEGFWWYWRHTLPGYQYTITYRMYRVDSASCKIGSPIGVLAQQDPVERWNHYGSLGTSAGDLLAITASWDQGVLPWLITDVAAKNHQVGCAPIPEVAHSFAYGAPSYPYCPPLQLHDDVGPSNILMDATFSCEETAVESSSWGAVKTLFR